MRKNWLVLDWEISNRIDRMGLDLVVLFHNGNDTIDLQNQFKEISPKIKQRMTVVLCDVGDGADGWRFGREYMVDNSSTPVVLIRSGDDRYFLREDVTLKTIKNFYNN